MNTDHENLCSFGGFVSSFMKTLSPEDTARVEIPLAEVLPELAGGVDTGSPVHEPPMEIGSYHQFPFNPDIKAVVIIPDFKVDTVDARGVLPSNYTREDTVRHNPLQDFNVSALIRYISDLQHAAQLTASHSLGRVSP